MNFLAFVVHGLFVKMVYELLMNHSWFFHMCEKMGTEEWHESILIETDDFVDYHITWSKLQIRGVFDVNQFLPGNP